MKIKRFKKFTEAVSGTSFPGNPFGPQYGRQSLPNSLSTEDTDVLMGIDGKFYTKSDFIDYLYPTYLTKNPGQILDGFSQENLDIVLTNM